MSNEVGDIGFKENDKVVLRYDHDISGKSSRTGKEYAIKKGVVYSVAFIDSNRDAHGTAGVHLVGVDTGGHAFAHIMFKKVVGRNGGIPPNPKFNLFDPKTWRNK